MLAGRLDRDYRADNGLDSDRLWLRADVDWQVSGLTTVGLAFESRIDETTDAGAAGIDIDELGLRVDHELLRNVILSGGYAHEKHRYNGTDRADDIDAWTLSANYLLNNHLRIRLGVAAEERDSSSVSQSFDETVLRLELRGAL